MMAAIPISFKAGAALSTVATFLQMGLLLFAIDQATLRAMGVILAAGGRVAAAYGLTLTLRALKAESPENSKSGRAFSIKTALSLAGNNVCDAGRGRRPQGPAG